MKIYEKISDWLKDFPSEETNVKILKIVNKAAEVENKKRKKVVDKLKKEIELKQQKLMELEAGGVIMGEKKPRKPRTKKVK